MIEAAPPCPQLDCVFPGGFVIQENGSRVDRRPFEPLLPGEGAVLTERLCREFLVVWLPFEMFDTKY